MTEGGDELPTDYVFRIVNKTNHKEFREFLSLFQVNELRNKLNSVASHPILEMGRTSPRRNQLSSSSTNDSSDGSNKSMSLDIPGEGTQIVSCVQTYMDYRSNLCVTLCNLKVQTNQAASIALVCSTMKRQIISRAFYGWLAYCRHLSTVRTHLSGLVNGRITPEGSFYVKIKISPFCIQSRSLIVDTEDGLTKEKWDSLHTEDGVVADDEEVYRLVYFGGVQHEIRKEVWPYLLGHYRFVRFHTKKK